MRKNQSKYNKRYAEGARKLKVRRKRQNITTAKNQVAVRKRVAQVAKNIEDFIDIEINRPHNSTEFKGMGLKIDEQNKTIGLY